MDKDTCILRTGEISIIDEPYNRIILINGLAFRYNFFDFLRENRQNDGMYYRICKPPEGTRGIFHRVYAPADIQDELVRQNIQVVERNHSIAKEQLATVENLLEETIGQLKENIKDLEKSIKTIDNFDNLPFLAKLWHIITKRSICD